MKIKLTAEEQRFIRSGGSVWCARQQLEGWQMVKLSQAKEYVFPALASRQEDAEMSVRMFANLSEGAVKTHHSIGEQP